MLNEGVSKLEDEEKGGIEILKCVGNEIRYRILELLKEREMCVSEIMGELEKEQPLVSHHLKALRECGLIQKRREGRKVIYEIADSSVSEFLSEVEDLSRKFC